jgi:hypothetical protein
VNQAGVIASTRLFQQHQSEAASTTAGKTLMLSAEEPRRHLFIDAADTQ